VQILALEQKPEIQAMVKRITKPKPKRKPKPKAKETDIFDETTARQTDEAMNAITNEETAISEMQKIAKDNPDIVRKVL